MTPRVPCFGTKEFQSAFVVSDLNATLRYWTETLKAGPFVVIRNALAGRRFVYRGKDVAPVFSVAFSYVGDTQIEFIAQHNSEASPYSEFLASGREGFHHIAIGPDDFDATCRHLEASGMVDVAAIYTVENKRDIVYYAGAGHLGSMVEVWNMTPARRQYFAGFKALVNTWDGTRPIREFESRAAFVASDDYKAALERIAR